MLSFPIKCFLDLFNLLVCSFRLAKTVGVFAVVVNAVMFQHFVLV